MQSFLHCRGIDDPIWFVQVCWMSNLLCTSLLVCIFELPTLFGPFWLIFSSQISGMTCGILQFSDSKSNVDPKFVEAYGKEDIVLFQYSPIHHSLSYVV